MPGYTLQSLGTSRTPLPQARRLYLSAWQKSHNSAAETAGENPVADTKLSMTF